MGVGVGGDIFGAGSAIYLTPEFAADIRTANPLDLDGPGMWSLVLLVDADDTEFEFRSSDDGCDEDEEADDDAGGSG